MPRKPAGQATMQRRDTAQPSSRSNRAGGYGVGEKGAGVISQTSSASRRAPALTASMRIGLLQNFRQGAVVGQLLKQRLPAHSARFRTW